MIPSAIVHRGREYPAYINDFVDQFFLFNKESILILVADYPFSELEYLTARYAGFKYILTEHLRPTRAHRFFSRWNRMNSTFRGGFWRFAIERFFVLEDLMVSEGLHSIIHFEYDNLVYFNVATFEETFKKTSKGISLPPDSIIRCIPSVVYIDTVDALSEFCHTYNRRYLIWKMNDMNAFHHYSKRKNARCSFLPVIPSWYRDNRSELRSTSGLVTADFDHFDHDYDPFQGIFDAAAFGQFLGGVDPRNDPNLGPGFINETAMYSPQEMPVHWERDDEDRLVPIVEYSGRKFPIFNLHIHSKALKDFRSDRRSVV